MPLIRFEDISLDIGEQKILAEANVSIETGERLCLIGRNGAGKTTTVEILEGLREPTSGFAEIDGIDVAKNAKAVKKIIASPLIEPYPKDQAK